MHVLLRVFVFGIIFAASQITLAEVKWGTLNARFTLNGKIPAREKVDLNKDIAVCMKKHPLSEELIVNPKNNGIHNVIVYLELKKTEKLPAIHPDYEKPATKPVRITNLNCRFEPHVSFVRVGRKVIFGNDDPIHHNILANMLYNAPFNLAIQPQGNIEQIFKRAERRPCQLTCPIHSWMKGYLVVKDHPYVGISDQNGKLEIKNIPVGKWRFQFWHEQPGYLKKLLVKNQTIEDRKGIYELEILPGKNDLGEIKMPVAVFE
jgi:plastocyanin